MARSCRAGRISFVSEPSFEEGRFLRYALVAAVAILGAGMCASLPLDSDFDLQVIGGWTVPLERNYVVLILANSIWVLVALHYFSSMRQPAASPRQKKADCKAAWSHRKDGDLSEEDFLSMGMPAEPHCEAGFQPATQLMHSNSAEAYDFDNELCKGQFLALHRPTHDRRLDQSGKYRYGDHFHGRKRLWELRFRLQCKRPIQQEELFFGNEMEEFVPMNAAAQSILNFTVNALEMVVGKLSYKSPGDPPEVAGERERPVITLPLWSFDQFIVTEEGATPPELTDPNLHNLGHKRCGQMRKYQDMVNGLELVPGPTFTFCIWGVSRFLDVIQWKLAVPIPFLGPLDLNQFVGKPPMHIVLYTLEDAGNEKRHLQSRKRYLFRLSFWSSLQRPKHEDVRRFAGHSLQRLQGLVAAAESQAANLLRAAELPRLALCGFNPFLPCMQKFGD